MRRTFTLAGLFGLAGVAFAATGPACSSEPSSAAPDAGEIFDAIAPRVDAGAPRDATSDAPDIYPCVPEQGCFGDCDSDIGWKPPPPIENVCSGADLARFGANLASPSSTTFFDLVSGIADPCRSCLIGLKTAATWSVVVTFTDDGEQGVVNYGACYALLDSAACGKFEAALSLCLFGACTGCDSSDAGGPQGCRDEAAKPTGACGGLVAEVKGACANPTADAPCADIVNAASIMCAGGTYDGGVVDGGGG